jgi:hypothetical protein
MDAYLAISEIATDENMTERMRAAVSQQSHLGNVAVGEPTAWVYQQRYVWASSPDWGASWDSALAAHPDDPAYEPGRDPAVITDAMILATVQGLAS